MVEDGVKIEDGFLQHYNHILMKYSEGITEPSHTGSTVQVKRVRPQVPLNIEFQDDCQSSHAIYAVPEPQTCKARLF